MEQVFFASDVHWRATEDDPVGAFGRFLEELAERAHPRARPTLFVLGDLFDFWWEQRGRILPFYEPHIAALRQATEAGVRIRLLFGNRDFTMRDALPRLCGVEVLGDRAEIEAGGKRVSMQHGDLLCTDDRRYQRYRRVIRSGPAKALMRLVPMSRVEAVVERMRRASRAEIERKPAGSMSVVDDAVVAELARGFDVVICGHVHRPERRPVAGGELIVLGPWDRERGWYAEATDGGVTLHEYTPEAD
jgi:UDP-2,3-diacylglucosamine hydrolase